MGKMTRNTALDEFYNQYNVLSDTKKDRFAKLCDKLLDDNFIYGQLSNDKDDYYAILESRDVIEAYFSLIDFQLNHDDINKIFFLKSSADRNRVRLKKMETVLLILLRRFYYIKNKESVDSNTNISIAFDELIDSLNQSGIFKDKDRIVKTQLLESMKTLKRFKIINFDVNNFEINNVVEIFPTIVFVVQPNDIESLNGKLKAYIGKGDLDDEIDED